MSKAGNPVKPERDRLARASGADPQIDREGGKFGAGIIRGVSLASVGEAIGHEMWLDSVTLDQVAELAQSKSDSGVKCRFTHPNMSSDGAGKHLGRLFDVKVEGEKVVGDLHFAKSSHESPEGNLAEYVMLLTEEDARAAGLSIAFEHDFEAESDFVSSNLESVEYQTNGKSIEAFEFRSPDPRNKENYRHVRLADLRAADVVDEPAANPDGLFDRSPLARQADELLSYAAGIREEKPAISCFDIDGDRAAQFLGRWLESHDLSIVPKKELTAMAEDKTPENPAAPEVTRESLLAEQKRYIDRFGADDGVQWFCDGKSYQDALELFCDKQREQIASLNNQLSEAEEKLSSIDLGEPEPVESQPVEGKPRGFASRIRVVGGPSNN